MELDTFNRVPAVHKSREGGFPPSARKDGHPPSAKGIAAPNKHILRVLSTACTSLSCIMVQPSILRGAVRSSRRRRMLEKSQGEIKFLNCIPHEISTQNH